MDPIDEAERIIASVEAEYNDVLGIAVITGEHRQRYRATIESALRAADAADMLPNAKGRLADLHEQAERFFEAVAANRTP